MKWKTIKGYNGYEVSDTGLIRSNSPWKKGKLLQPYKNKHGYLQVNLAQNKKYKTQYVHRLVAIAFLPNKDNYSQINHKDGIKTNNNIDNLEWCDCKHNIEHAIKSGLRSYKRGEQHKLSKKVIQKTKDGEIVKVWGGANEVSRELHYCLSSIICCCNNKPKYKTAYGYIWEYERGNKINAIL